MTDFPYFSISQFEEKFIVTKLPANYLIRYVDFEFRFPYKNSEKDILTATKYLEKSKRMLNEDIQIKSRENAIQRRTDLNRVEDIADYINANNKSILFPTPLILGINIYNNSDENMKDTIIFNEEKQTLSFDENNTAFTIIDGQHRLLGIARYHEKYNQDISTIELPIILMPDADLQNATKTFIDINANQKKVNRSIVYDLYDNINEPTYTYVKNIKAVVQALNENKSSVLYNKIKMLGTGDGSISLAFMIDYISGEILNNENDFDMKKLLVSLNNYFTVIKSVFPDNWNDMLKTTGMGALLMYYPIAEKEFGKFYYEGTLSKLEEHLKTKKIPENSFVGTGKKAQKNILSILK